MYHTHSFLGSFLKKCFYWIKCLLVPDQRNPNQLAYTERHVLSQITRNLDVDADSTELLQN